MKRKDDMPEWVYLGLLGINSRNAALGFLWLVILIAAGCLIAGLSNPFAFYGLGILVVAPWYWYAIKWVDEHSSWGD